MIDDLIRERDILNKSLVKSTNAAAQQGDLLKINENTKRNLENDINSYRTSALSLSNATFVCFHRYHRIAANRASPSHHHRITVTTASPPLQHYHTQALTTARILTQLAA